MGTSKNYKQVHSPKYWQKKSGSKRKNRKSNKNISKQKIIKFGIYSFVSLILFGLIFVSILFVWISKDLPEPGKLQKRLLAETTKIYDRTGEHLLYEIHGDQKRTLIKLEEIPDHTKFAFIALEDKNFWQHKGLSLKHIFKAVIFYSFKKIGLYRGLVPGGSTLTQQFVKNSILTREKTLARKLKEWILAYQIEKKFTKEQILELYFNEIPFGSTAYGIESAAQTYLAKSAKDLTLAESAILAAMIQAPTYYSPYGNHTDELYNRQKFVLSEMVDMGFVSEQEVEEAKKQNIKFERSISNIKAPHFVLYVKEQLTEKFGERLVEQGGLKVFTSLDIYKQNIAEETINKFAEGNQKNWEASNAALVSLDPKTGEILAMVGSKDFFNEEIDGQVNIALRARQPGSSFKPIVYTAAWQQGYFPETVIFDVVTKFKTETGKDYEPHNYDYEEHGPVSLKKALQGSLNISAVKTIYLAGVSNVLDLAEKLGYTTLSDRSRFGLSLVLGGGEIKLLEHVAAFGVIAREGIKQEPISILKIEDASGNILDEVKIKKGDRVMNEQIARITNYILSDDNARSYVFGTRSLLTLPNRSVASKTGTTNNYRDAWTIGYTPSLVTGVWVGNNNNSEMKKGASGYQVAAPIWHEYMSLVLGDTPPEEFKKPKYELPEKSMLGGSIGKETIVTIDKSSGLLASEYTPEHLKENKTYRELHNILYFINKNNLSDPEPGYASNDIQFESWEQAVVTWAIDQEIDINEEPPKEFDNIHILKNKPFLAILEPWPDSKIDKSFNVRIEWEALLPIKKIEYYVDDVLLVTKKNNFTNQINQLLILPNTFLKGDHYLKIVIYDEEENSNLAWHKIILK